MSAGEISDNCAQQCPDQVRIDVVGCRYPLRDVVLRQLHHRAESPAGERNEQDPRQNASASGNREAQEKAERQVEEYVCNEVAAASATEEVINRLGSVDPSHLKVIDRLTATKFRRLNECIIHIGQALGAEYVMEGSLQKSHTTAALYRVADNTQMWATAVDSRAQNAPELISARIASTFATR